MYDPTLRKKISFKEFLKGQLITSNEKSITNNVFNYAQIKKRSYTQMVGQIDIDFIAVTETIYTSRIDLHFGSGSKIKMHDGNTMNVENVEKDFNQFGKMIGWFLYLNGGGK